MPVSLSVSDLEFLVSRSGFKFHVASFSFANT